MSFWKSDPAFEELRIGDRVLMHGRVVELRQDNDKSLRYVTLEMTEDES